MGCRGGPLEGVSLFIRETPLRRSSGLVPREAPEPGSGHGGHQTCQDLDLGCPGPQNRETGFLLFISHPAAEFAAAAWMGQEGSQSLAAGSSVSGCKLTPASMFSTLEQTKLLASHRQLRDPHLRKPLSRASSYPSSTRPLSWSFPLASASPQTVNDHDQWEGQKSSSLARERVDWLQRAGSLGPGWAGFPGGLQGPC